MFARKQRLNFSTQEKYDSLYQRKPRFNPDFEQKVKQVDASLNVKTRVEQQDSPYKPK